MSDFALQRFLLGGEFLLLGGEFGYILFKSGFLALALTVVFVLVNMAGFGTTDATFQPEAFHCLGIGVLKSDKVIAGHDVVGTETSAVLRFSTVSLSGFCLARLLLSLGGDYRHDRDMKVRCLLVHMEMGTDNILFSECFLCPADT